MRQPRAERCTCGWRRVKRWVCDYHGKVVGKCLKCSKYWQPCFFSREDATLAALKERL